MKTIKLHGEVGWEMWGSSVISQLDALGGDDVTVDFSSVGGDVFEGVEIYNAFSDYKRKNPKAQIIFDIKGVMASMGSYIPSNPAIDKVRIESNVSGMWHNPWNFVAGDYKTMQANADFLEGLTKMIAPSYANISGKPVDEIRTMMDNETWLFGQDIIDAGFADEIIPSEETIERAVAISRSKMNFSEMKKRFKELNEGKLFDSERAASILKKGFNMRKTAPKMGDSLGNFLNNAIDDMAGDDSEERSRIISRIASASGISESTVNQILSGSIICPPLDRLEGFAEVLDITIDSIITSAESDGCKYDSNNMLIGCHVNGALNIKPAPVGNLKTEVPMNEAELKKDNPELYASMIKKGADDEREQNNARVKALTEMKGKDEYKDLPEVAETIDKAIMEGTAVEAVYPLITATMMKIMKDPARMATIESPGEIAGGDGEDLTPKTKQNAEV